MSWIKKQVRKVSKTFKRASHGKFHLNPLKNGVHATSDPLGHLGYKLLPSKLQHKISRRLSWGRVKRSHKLGLSHLLGNNSASNYAPSYVSGVGLSGPYYQYSGRTISEMM